ncbi:MAG: hypothetical protein O3C68_01755 [Proteobacteria bacterium]|nr:hypothetical protein [Pseudomonadota bacterium]
MKSLGKLESVSPDLLGTPGASHFCIEHFADYETTPASVLLQVILLHHAGEIYTLISDQGLPPGIKVSNPEDLTSAAKKMAAEPICLTRPLELETVSIPKPWGQEIWYSGIEQRGVSTVKGVPLPWLLSVFGDYLGCTGSPMLLKILDPFPEPNLGDLYFEMHEKKIEVYVVTQVNPVAWPSGTGKIRYGFNQDVINEFDSVDKFRDSYQLAVTEYRFTRNEIDAELKSLRKKVGIVSGEPLEPAQYLELLEQIDPALKIREEQLRQTMYRYTGMLDLSIGDVVTVAPMVPHSLQHGVRVIEFQTPHYERYILSFGQEVLTQDHWDTDSALSGARTEVSSPESPVKIAPGRDLIADFDAFNVTRLMLAPGDSAETQHGNYTMVIGVTGEMALDDLTTIGPEQAFFQAPKETLRFTNRGSSPATVLIAEENTPAS